MFSGAMQWLVGIRFPHRCGTGSILGGGRGVQIMAVPGLPDAKTPGVGESDGAEGTQVNHFLPSQAEFLEGGYWIFSLPVKW